MTRIVPYDTAAYEQFCMDLADEGFNPSPASPNIWIGPIHASLKQFTDAEFMQVRFRDGWPLRYAYVIVEGLRVRHAGSGIVCLWAEDDPAQLAGSTAPGLWARIDEWADASANGFDVADQALDSFMLFPDLNGYVLEVPLADLADKTNGYIAPLTAQVRGQLVQVGADRGNATLRGVFYLRRDIGMPPASFEELRDMLTRRQRGDLDRGLAERSAVERDEPSGGYDFVVLAWPRFEQHDVLAVGFEGAGDTLKVTAYTPSPSDATSRRRRSGPDADLLAPKRVLVAGLGSIGGGVALTLAECGVGAIRGHDDDVLKTSNLVRHVLADFAVGYTKSIGLATEIGGRAPWCDFDAHPHDLSLDRSRLQAQIAGFDLIIDCTGLFSLTAALSEVCHGLEIPLVTVALFHQGNILRIQRQAPGDLPIANRIGAPGYVQIPPDPATPAQAGFLEVGCTAYVNNAPPWTSHRAAADTAATAIDFLIGRRDFPEDQVVVLRPLADKPFDRVGPVEAETP